MNRMDLSTMEVPTASPRGKVRQRQSIWLWLAGFVLLLLSAGWCRLNMAEMFPLHDAPSLETEQPARQTQPPKPIAVPDEIAAHAPHRIFDPLFQPCQATVPVAIGGPPLCGVDCGFPGSCGAGWGAMRPIDFQPYGPGEYVGHDRLAHVPVYRLRVDDQLECLYRLTREETAEPYQFNVGDELQIESATDEKLNRNAIVQPDGTITLRLLGQVKATRSTVTDLRDKLESLYGKYYPTPAISVTPLKVNTRLEDLRATVDNRSGVVGGQGVQVRITPEGTISLPAIGSVPAQGLTLAELKAEIDHRYAATISGIEITPVLAARAPRFCYVLGEVRIPGRYVLEGPTTIMQAIALAGQLERRRQSEASRGLPPRRRLAAFGHDGQPGRRLALRQPALPAR